MKRTIYGLMLLGLAISLALPLVNYLLGQNFFIGFGAVVAFTTLFAFGFGFLFAGMEGMYGK